MSSIVIPQERQAEDQRRHTLEEWAAITMERTAEYKDKGSPYGDTSAGFRRWIVSNEDGARGKRHTASSSDPRVRKAL